MNSCLIDLGEVADFIQDRLIDADSDPTGPPYDELRQYGNEGGLTPPGSLSPLTASDEEPEKEDWEDNIPTWGPRFHKIANMYGGGLRD